MKNLLLATITAGLIIAGYFIYKSRGILPLVLPPAPISSPAPSTSKETVNEASLTIASKFSLRNFAKNIQGARNLEFSPDGTLLVSVPQAGKIIALPDKNNDNKADEQKTVLSNLSNPHGFTFEKGKLYVVEETKVSRYSWDESNLKAMFEKKILDLPKGDRHSTRTIVFDESGEMFISIGSTCNVCLEKNDFLATVITANTEGNNARVYAKGLRNAVFIAFNPKTQELWGTEMGRDFLGDNLPPDEINIFKDGKDYGWPICYGNKIHDTDFDKNQYLQDPCLNTEPPVYEIAAHSAPLGLTFVNTNNFPSDWQGDLLVAYHGSWNRSTPIGYKVVRIKITNGKPAGEEDFISGFLQGSQANARPVDLIFDKSGNLFISDDKAGFIFKVSYQN